MPFLPTILEVAIGLALIFFTLSAICSSLSDMVSNLLDLRSKYLEQGIVALLSDPRQIINMMGEIRNPQSDNAVFIKSVIDHPILQKLDLSQQPNPIVRNIRQRVNTGEITLPSYVSADSFATALVENLFQKAQGNPQANIAVDQAAGDRLAQLHTRVQALSDNLQQTSQKAIPQQVLAALSNVDPKQALEQTQLVLPLIEDANVRATVTNMLSAYQLNEIRQGINKLSDSRAKRVLLAFVDQTQANIQKIDDFKGLIGGWFDESMGQVTIWYKQHINVFLRIFAALVCLALNADVLRITDTLWRDPTVRAALVAQAQTTVQATPTPQLTPAPGATPSPSTGFNNAVQNVQVQLQKTEGLPVGWSCNDFNAIFRAGSTTSTTPLPLIFTPFPGFCDQITTDSGGGGNATLYVVGGSFSLAVVFIKLIGISLMAIGVSLGSNFWYKILAQLINLREDKAAAAS